MVKSSSHFLYTPRRRTLAALHRAAACSLISTLALLTPSLAAAASHIDSGAATTALNATAHLNFKIVIPKVLYLRVASEDDRAAGARTVAVMSTGHQVVLMATVRGLEGGNVILTAAARRSIAQDVPCTRGSEPIVCTASMP